MTPDAILAKVVQDYPALTPPILAKMTMQQIVSLYYRQEEKPKPISYQELFWSHWRNLGKSEEQIQARWEAYVKQQKQKG